MTNWKDFFDKYLIQTGYYRIDKSEKSGDTIIDTFVSTNNNDKTYIKTGYLTGGELIYCEILNPDALGHNRYQKQEYFYRFDFTPGESYGPPGLEFNDTNIDAIKSLLKNGLIGKEIQYYSNEKLIKSVIYKKLNDKSDKDFGITIWFQKHTIFNKIKKTIFGQRINYTIREINLNKLFKGLIIND